MLHHNAHAAKMTSLRAAVMGNHKIWELTEIWRSSGLSLLTARWKKKKKQIKRYWVTSPGPRLLGEILHWNFIWATRQDSPPPCAKIALHLLSKQQFWKVLVLGSFYALKLLRTPKRFCWYEFYLSTFSTTEMKAE